MTTPPTLTPERWEILLEALRAPGAGTALPNWAFTDAAFAEYELTKTFEQDWVAVCSEADLAKPESYVATTIGREPVVVLRDKEGQLKAVSNTCRHRGALLVEGRGEARNLQCPYHRWTYGLDGRFKGAPYDDRGADKSARCLPSYAVDVWNGVVFAHLDPAASPLRERLAGLATHLGDAGAGTWHGWDSRSEDPDAVWKANWKVVHENAAEAYHLFAVHPKTLEPYAPTKSSYYIDGNEEWTLSGGTLAGGGTYWTLVVPPSFVAIIDSHGMSWLGVRPVAVDQTAIYGGYSSPHRETTWSKISAAFSAWPSQFLEEDRVLLETVQRGLASTRSQGSKLLEVERVLGDIHRYLGSRLIDETS